jgi:ABC-2 type transport system ATP-binding protein
MPHLAAEEVVKAYDQNVAVDRVSFEVDGGEVFGLLGPNGAGKSTLIRMTMDILRPDAGRILLDGAPSTSADHDRVGYLPEERGLYRKAKVIDVLDYFARLKGMKGPGVKAKAMAALERVGLAAWAKKKVQALSKGMQQKVQIVGTVLHDPAIVLLDEPFAGLDPINTRMIKEMIAQLKREGRLVMLSTHQMADVEELCDRIVMIDRGRRVLYGTVREIKKRYAAELRAMPGRGNVVLVDGDGDFAALPGVVAVEAAGANTKLTLDPSVAPDRFLATALEAGISVSRFEAHPTPLEEIFVHVVASNAGASA